MLRIWLRPKSANQHAMPNYVACAPRMYKGVIESLVRRMIPFADLIQITHLKTINRLYLRLYLTVCLLMLMD